MGHTRKLFSQLVGSLGSAGEPWCGGGALSHLHRNIIKKISEI